MSYGELDLEAIQKSNGFGRACFLPRNKKPDLIRNNNKIIQWTSFVKGS